MKTNKTKPIKKIMIFTIITVMIASLFALPTFAVVSNVVWDDVSGNITPITVSPETTSTSVNTEGYYCISIDSDDITSAMQSMIGQFGASLNFNIFGHVPNNLALYENGFVRLYYFDGGWVDYENDYDNGNDTYYTTLSFNGSNDLIEIGCPSRSGLTKYDLNNTIIKIDIIIPQYPVGNGLGNEQADAFWNNVVYSVYQYSQETLADYEISGIWEFNFDLELIEVTQMVYFTSGGNTYSEMSLSEATFGNLIPQLEYDGNVILQGTWMQDWAQVVDFGDTPQVVSEQFYNMMLVNAVQQTSTDPEEPDDPTPPADGEEQGIFAVWSQITQWIVQGLASVSNAFYADGKLTLLGTLCIIPLALGLALLLISIVQKFLHLRG